MARNRDPFTLALQTLRLRARDGVFAPDRAIVILDEAQRLRLSTTPIREALAWLGGEGMIERAPNGGYMGLRQDAASVSGRYRLRLTLLTDALTAPPPALDDWTPSDDAALADLLATIARLGGDDVLWRAYERVARQLAWLGPAEAETLPDFEPQVAALREALRSERSQLLARLERLHDRLIGSVAAILLAARRPQAATDLEDSR